MVNFYTEKTNLKNKSFLLKEINKKLWIKNVFIVGILRVY